MTSNKDVPADDSADFVLKYRITGAAFLMIFGVLFLPWLLGAPTEASKNDVALTKPGSGEVSRTEMEKELLAAAENEMAEEEIEIYVSKITPLDALRGVVASDQKTNSTPESKLPKPTLATPKISPETVGIKADKSNNDSQSTATTVINEADVEIEPVSVAKVEVLPEDVKKTVTVGWVVQVGVFTDVKGAAKVVTDLKLKGFTPSTTVVDTNIGKASGTRVWLGPYAQRVDAAKAKTSLKNKTGGDGFIRAYP